MENMIRIKLITFSDGHIVARTSVASICLRDGRESLSLRLYCESLAIGLPSK